MIQQIREKAEYKVVGIMHVKTVSRKDIFLNSPPQDN